MRRLHAAALCAALVAGNAHAATEFTAVLNGAQVAPTPTTESGTGIAIGVLTGGPGTWSFNYSVFFSGFDFGTNFGSGPSTPQTGDDVRNFHIHTNVAGLPGPLVYSVRQPDYEHGTGPNVTFLTPTVVRIDGSWDLIDGNNTASATATTGVGNLAFWAQQMINAAPGQALPLYFDIHTEAFPGSAIRGQIVAAVPEPETYAMMLVGLGLVGWQMRRTARRSNTAKLV